MSTANHSNESSELALQRAPNTANEKSVFQESLPVLITSMINKSGSIGLSLLPMLLVEGHYTTGQSSLAMSCVKGSTIVATLVSGWMGDSVGLRPTLLVSFLLAAIGLTVIPIHWGFVALLVSAVIAQLGITSINGTQRLLLTRTVQRRNQKESLGWMRFVNNLGQILSFSLASMSAMLGARILIWFDALTSFLAFVVGSKILPDPPRHVGERAQPTHASSNRDWWPFVGCTLLIAGWNFMYEFFNDGVAGKLKLLYPMEGLRIFSLLMVLNTVICAAVAVLASRILNRVVPSLVAGAILTGSAVILAFQSFHSYALLFVSMILLTMGEVIYGALGQFLLIRSVPASNRENTLYSAAILVANAGRMIAASLAFPLVIYRDDAKAATACAIGVAAGSAVILVVGMRRFRDLGEDPAS